MCLELYTLLLEDILVLLQRQDEKLILKCHSKNLAGTAETKHIFSPIIKLNTVMVRSVATGKKRYSIKPMIFNGNFNMYKNCWLAESDFESVLDYVPIMFSSIFLTLMTTLYSSIKREYTATEKN